MARKQAEQDRLRKAEKFMKQGTGQAECTACGYSYDPRKGDPEYPVSPGTKFEVRMTSTAFRFAMLCNRVCRQPFCDGLQA